MPAEPYDRFNDEATRCCIGGTLVSKLDMDTLCNDWEWACFLETKKNQKRYPRGEAFALCSIISQVNHVEPAATHYRRL